MYNARTKKIKPKKINKSLVFCCFVFLCAFVASTKLASETFLYNLPKPEFKSIDVIVGLSKPPYVIEANDTGYEIELITAVLNRMQLEPKYIYVPLGRTLRMLDQGMGNMLLTINDNIVPNSKIRTNSYVTYRNVAVYKKDSNFKVHDIKSLRTKSVAAFQNATKYLGDEYTATVRFNNNYIEVPSQYQQVKLLIEGRIEVAVMDENIFWYIINQLKDEVTHPTEFVLSPIFQPSQYSAAFKNPGLVKPFNRALKVFKQSNEYLQLKKKYNIKHQ